MPVTDLKLLALIVAANAGPVLARVFLGPRLSIPLDGGRCAPDGRPWLGPSKTWRGVAASLVLTAPIALALGFAWEIALLVPLAAMAGDLLASFCKRRLGLPASARATGLDQIPESLLPMLAVSPLLDLGWIDVIGTSLVFTALELLMSPPLYRLGLRRRPY